MRRPLSSTPSLTAGVLALLGLGASLWWAQRTLGDGFLPHGYCLTWIPGLLWLHVVSDSLIALSYLSIPLALAYFVRRRHDVPMSWLFVLFGAFIVACGATHAFDVWTLWHADYWLSGGVKAVTAAVSVSTAVALVVAMPRALAIPSVVQLEQAKRQLEAEVQARREAEAQLRQLADALERRVAERTAQLRQANALLDAVFDAAPVGLAVFDADDRYLRVNPTLARMNGADVEAHAGRPPEAVVPGLATPLAEHLRTVRETGRPLIGAELADLPTGGVLRCSYFVVPGGDERPRVAAICEDISQRRAADLERTRLLQEAQEANRQKDEFLARVSHELRTPLQALMSWVALLRNGGLDAAASARALGRIDHNVRLQARMISDLLDVSRILSGRLSLEPRLLDPEPVVARVLEGLAGEMRDKRLALEWRPDGRPLATMVDEHRLEQVLNNVIGNAVQYTPAGGRVEVQSRSGPEGWTLEVRDDGIGIDADELAALFQPFRRSRSASASNRHGLGLGLAISRNIVKLMGGSLTADSAGAGQGSCFTLRLPLASAAAAIEPAPAALGAVPLDGLRLLYVEDDADIGESTAQALRTLGATVMLAADPAQAMAAAARATPDVVVSDLRLADGRSGHEVVQQLRAAGVRVPCIALSAFGAQADLEATRSSGFERHLVKPVDAPDIATAVLQVLGRLP